jgi:GAF domain-containing protein
MDHEGASSEEVAGRLGELLMGDAGIGAVMDFVAHQAILVVPGASEAGIMLVRGEKITSDAQTSDVIKKLDTLQLESDEGPCLVAAREGQVVECSDLGHEERFPTFAAAAVRSGLRSSLSMPLRLKDRSLGSLNVHSGNAGSFTEESHAITSQLAETAAIVFANAESLQEQARLAEQLRTALETRDAIGMAKGIIMERENVGREQAFEMLVRLSQNKNTKLREIAEQLVGSVEAKFES